MSKIESVSRRKFCVGLGAAALAALFSRANLDVASGNGTIPSPPPEVGTCTTLSNFADVDWGQTSSGIEVYGSSQHPLTQQDIELLRAEFAQKFDADIAYENEVPVAYAFTPDQWDNLGKNFGYVSTLEYLSTHVAVLQDILQRGGLTVLPRVSHVFILKPGAYFPASYHGGWQDNNVSGLYGISGTPWIDGGYAGPGNTAYERDVQGRLIDFGIIHEWMHQWLSVPDTYAHDFDFRDDPPDVLAALPRHWQYFFFSNQFSGSSTTPGGTLMSSVGDLLDPEIAWLLGNREAKKMSSLDPDRFASYDFQNRNEIGDTLTLQLPTWLAGTTMEVYRTVGMPQAATAEARESVQQMDEEVRAAFFLREKTGFELLETAAVPADGIVTVSQPFADLPKEIYPSQSAGLLLFKNTSGSIVGLRPVESGLFLLAQPFTTQQRLNHVTLSMDIAKPSQTQENFSWKVTFPQSTNWAVEQYQGCYGGENQRYKFHLPLIFNGPK